MKLIFLLLFIFGINQFANSQNSNHVSIEQLGISFDIPEGWQGQELNKGILLQHRSIRGIIFISTHNYSKSQLLQEAQNGMNDGQGTNLRLVSQVADLSSTAIGGDYEGYLEGNATRAYIIGAENPHQGLGVIILATATPEQYSEQLKEASLELFRSFEFTKVDASEVLSEWKTFLSGKRLQYFERYNSFEGGTSGSYSINRTIDLCPQGYFIFGNNNSFEIDGLSPNREKNKGSGTWEIITGGDGSPTLKLHYHNGEESFYRLKFSEEKLFLNGERYFRQEGNEILDFCR